MFITCKGTVVYEIVGRVIDSLLIKFLYYTLSEVAFVSEFT